MMRGRVTLLRAAAARVPVVLRPRPGTAFLGLLLLCLGAGAALGQTATGYPAVDFGTTLLGAGVTRAVLSLTPAADRVIDSVTLAGATSNVFAVAAGSCAATSTLTAGSTCTVSVTFTPTIAGCSQALLQVASHDKVSNAPFLDVAALIGSGVGPTPPGTVPLVEPFTAQFQGPPVVTPVTGTRQSNFTLKPAVLSTRGGLNQLSVQGSFVTTNVGALPIAPTLTTLQFTGQQFPLLFSGPDTLALCAAGSAVPSAAGTQIQETFYVATGTGHFAGATGSGQLTGTLGSNGVLVAQVTGTLTLHIPTAPFAYIYLADLIRLY